MGGRIHSGAISMHTAAIKTQNLPATSVSSSDLEVTPSCQEVAPSGSSWQEVPPSGTSGGEVTPLARLLLADAERSQAPTNGVRTCCSSRRRKKDFLRHAREMRSGAFRNRVSAVSIGSDRSSSQNRIFLAAQAAPVGAFFKPIYADRRLS